MRNGQHHIPPSGSLSRTASSQRRSTQGRRRRTGGGEALRALHARRWKRTGGDLDPVGCVCGGCVCGVVLQRGVRIYRDTDMVGCDATRECEVR